MGWQIVDQSASWGRGAKREKTRAYGQTIRPEDLFDTSRHMMLTCDTLGNLTAGHCISPRLVCLSSWTLEVRAISATN
ncbi:uncharacterized protein N7500_000642 [Penicillium coprophilum]|uniref:uncharacterized protein n=1 Tax=Penicillium coprophilum TaxID=36646 RepID=UPI0023977EEF|nr:uncharacterized protein N7500_000642 [Penicillium coprophilum]KAJ5177943.1 hypothetical protein N7500_000642 [Penicillium coprophilum]